jgi:hypothetical protein
MFASQKGCLRSDVISPISGYPVHQLGNVMLKARIGLALLFVERPVGSMG